MDNRRTFIKKSGLFFNKIFFNGKKPKIKIVIITSKKALILEPGISVKKFSTKISPPKPLKTREKSDAPIRIKKTIELIFRVCRQTSDKITLSNFFTNKNGGAHSAPPHQN